MNSSISRNDLDGLLYKTVSGNVIVEDRTVEFSFDVEHYHEMIHYGLYIVNRHDKMTLKIVD